MAYRQIIYVAAFPGWIAGVTYQRSEGYRCWVLGPNQAVLNDGATYPTSQAAIAAGRLFIHHALQAELDAVVEENPEPEDQPLDRPPSS
ncbi:MAG TPA: hypothetical protein IGR64_08085 [Leptolyngbyaceae cyanobacterium M65_K2018_010]|nr:hypothetical protein [Leptolyngbyaceae cyanobacterium M65_K2018_010]